jgi:hypothetical protein
LFFCIALLFSGCGRLNYMLNGDSESSSDQEFTDTNQELPNTIVDGGATGQTGRWVGHMYLVTKDGLLATDHSGITVTLTAPTSLASTGISSLPTSVQTDASGKFVFPDMVTGLYTISFSKENYGTMHYYNIPFTGGGDQTWAPYGSLRFYPAITQLPGFEISEVRMNAISFSSFVTISIDVDPLENSPDRAFVCFLSDSPDVSSQNYKLYFIRSNTRYPYVVSVGTTLPFPFYIQIYPVSAFNNSLGAFSEAGVYSDPITNKAVFPSIGNPSATLRIDAPTQ